MHCYELDEILDDPSTNEADENENIDHFVGCINTQKRGWCSTFCMIINKTQTDVCR